MTDLPPPFTPPEADLQDFPFMPLHVARLRDSDLAAECHPEACWYAVLLWAASWHQLPAGSLPENEAILARLCGLGRDVRTFRRHREEAMRGFVRCSDGRLYHPVVAEQVNVAWKEKVEYRERKAARRAIAEKAAAARWSNAGDEPDADASAMHDASPPDASCIADAMPKGTGKGRGTGINEDADASSPRKRATRLPPDWQPGSLPPTVRELVDQWPPGRFDRELDGFRDYWASRNADAARLDWDKTWHNRIRDQHDRIMRERPNGQRDHDPRRNGRGTEEPIFAARRDLGIDQG